MAELSSAWEEVDPIGRARLSAIEREEMERGTVQVRLGCSAGGLGCVKGKGRRKRDGSGKKKRKGRGKKKSF